MLSLQLQSFADTRGALTTYIVQAPQVKTERWQGRDVSKDPAAVTYELRNVTFEVPLHGIEDLDHWRQDTGANIPWADDHFLERVGGEPLNPGVQWANWPWAGSAARFQKEEIGPRFPPQDWAYLAGFIDGEASIKFQKDRTPVICVYQKDRFVLDWLANLFKVGKIYFVSHDEDENRFVDSEPKVHEMHRWHIHALLEVRWVLVNCLPYLKVKKEKAEKGLLAIETILRERASSPAGRPPLKKVWGQNWPARFNHTYMSRLWPKKLDGGSNFIGHDHEYGDLKDLVELLVREPFTRQAWIPLFHPQDTGYGDGGRKVCTLGYQVLVRRNAAGRCEAHIWYPLRSCDLIRHYPDDCYLAVRLLLWIVEQCRRRDPEFWDAVTLGTYAMHMTSLHIFENDRRALLGT